MQSGKDVGFPVGALVLAYPRLGRFPEGRCPSRALAGLEYQFSGNTGQTAADCRVHWFLISARLRQGAVLQCDNWVSELTAFSGTWDWVQLELGVYSMLGLEFWRFEDMIGHVGAGSHCETRRRGPGVVVEAESRHDKSITSSYNIGIL